MSHAIGSTLAAMGFDELREDYEGKPLRRHACDADPIRQFQVWMDEALAADVPMANAMTLATVDKQGLPHARIVLLKEFDARGFVFFSNYQSDKAEEMAATGNAALVFWWHPLTRQVRIEGRVQKISDPESDAYFDSRPRASNLVAMASAQSRPVADRKTLQATIDAEVARAGDLPLQRPASWGGYRVEPARIEFWQGQPDRSHDRLVYRKLEREDWEITRLFP